jgi:hypothetical protein
LGWSDTSFFWFGFRPEDFARDRERLILPTFLLYVVTYAVGIFFQGAVVAGATERMRGGDPTLESALRVVTGRIGRIIMWAIVAATVGMVLRAIQDRAGFLGKIAVGLVGAVWSLATFFVVPVLVLEDLPVGAAYARSLEIFEEKWGEAFVGSAGIGLAATLAWIALFGVVFLLLAAHLVVGAIAVVVAGFIALSMFFSALQGVYVASRHSFASRGQIPPGFDASLLKEAFVRKDR